MISGKPLVSIIIVNFNVWKMIESCLQSILHHCNGCSFEIIVVDNASTDCSATNLPGMFPEIKFIANQKNVGFGAANNQGIILSKGEYILLLNPDTVLLEDPFPDLISFMAEHTDAGMISYRLLSGDKSIQPTTYTLPNVFGEFCHFFNLKSLVRSKIIHKYLSTFGWLLGKNIRSYLNST
ncbi:MAG: glycosyltransferase family 2 protein [Waddliaceae bacterium]